MTCHTPGPRHECSLVTADVALKRASGVHVVFCLLFFGTRAGIRFDVRYFKTFDDLEILGVPIAQSPGKVDFTRTSLGFVLRF